MAGSVTVTMSNPFAQGGNNRIVVDWTATAGGAVSVALASDFSTDQLSTFGYAAPQPSKFRGRLVKVETAPGASGDLATTLPTAAYDITLLGAHGEDIAGGYLADRSGTVAEQWVPIQPVAVDGEITFTVANAGAATTGRVILHFEGEKNGCKC